MVPGSTRVLVPSEHCSLLHLWVCWACCHRREALHYVGISHFFGNSLVSFKSSIEENEIWRAIKFLVSDQIEEYKSVFKIYI